ncbi:MAG: STAS/SEC14 domain-containing protein [Erythrobacter sp.]|uniref:STAS/SEC14 domain-containing protein n=1 Tax=Erythrobacter sp. TaxID=1042 RepID=UPI0032EE9E1D
MASLAPSHSISVDRHHAELHFAISGLWTVASMQDFLVELREKVKPFLRDRAPFSALGDLRDFVPQDRQTAQVIRDSLLVARDNGLTRFAVVSSAPLVRMQYRRITDGVEVEFFDAPDEARRWLRSA